MGGTFAYILDPHFGGECDTGSILGVYQGCRRCRHCDADIGIFYIARKVMNGLYRNYMGSYVCYARGQARLSTWHKIHAGNMQGSSCTVGMMRGCFLPLLLQNSWTSA